ncbi:MAG: LytR/AlgR family response regulator transcription factor [Gelidibacter sp.]|uniref:LytR/AlgR family response regulator transcription factor n=1 Tax=Gelidibacter sp. TaxID=2018083 RepID=UPI003263D94C
MKALVIDDEELARKRVLKLLETVPQIEVLGECSNGKTAIISIDKLQPDLIFLDINMKDMNGFEVLQKMKISPKPIVIFVTAYNNYALKAFEVEAFDFLLKPFKDQRFFRIIDRVLKTSKSEADANFKKRFEELFHFYSMKSGKVPMPTKFLIRQGNKTILINPLDIMYITSSGYYVEIFVANKKYMLREALTKLCDGLDEAVFFRIHRSSVVNINFVREIVHSSFSEIDAKMTDNKMLRISKSHKNEFLEKIGIS